MALVPGMSFNILFPSDWQTPGWQRDLPIVTQPLNKGFIMSESDKLHTLFQILASAILRRAGANVPSAVKQRDCVCEHLLKCEEGAFSKASAGTGVNHKEKHHE